MTDSKVEFYAPAPVPDDYDREYLQQELIKLQSIIETILTGHAEKTNIAPDKLYDGLVRYADGTNWDPGLGEGYYIYRNSAWRKLAEAGDLLTTPISVANGGTGVATLGNAGVLIGNGTGVVQVTGAGTAGEVLTSNGAGVDPSFQVINFNNTAIRQAVLTGLVDADGVSNFISAASGLACDLDAASAAITLAYANGYNGYGAVDFFEQISANPSAPWTSLTANAENYLYRTYDTGYGFTVNLPPCYGITYQEAEGVGRMYSSFEGTDEDTSFTDANGEAWTFSGNAKLDSAQAKFGTTSLYLDGVGDWITLDNGTFTLHPGVNEGGFEIGGWFYVESLAANRTIFGTVTNLHFELYVTTAGELGIKLGNGASWSITAGTFSSGAGITTGGWYRVRMIWDGATYKVYLSNNGAAETEEISLTSSTGFGMASQEFRVGAATTSSPYKGWIQDIWFAVGPQTAGTETPPATVRGGLPEDNEHWFDTNEMKMKQWSRATASWTVVKKVFLGQATTGASSVSSVVSYRLGNKARLKFPTYASGAQEKAHTCGYKPRIQDWVLHVTEYGSGAYAEEEYRAYTYATNASGNAGTQAIVIGPKISIFGSGTLSFTGKSGANVGGNSEAYWVAYLERGW